MQSGPWATPLILIVIFISHQGPWKFVVVEYEWILTARWDSAALVEIQMQEEIPRTLKRLSKINDTCYVGGLLGARTDEQAENIGMARLY